MEVAPTEALPRLRVAFLNNYDMGLALERWKTGDYPGQHLFGITHFPEHGLDVDIIPFGRVGRTRAWINHRIGDVVLQWRVLLRCSHYDVIYSASQNDTLALALLRRMRLLRTPIVATMHHPAQGPLLRPWLFRLAYGGHDRLLCMDEDIYDETLRFGLPQSKVTLVGWCVDLAFYEPEPVPSGPDVPLVLTAGKIKRDYGSLLRGIEGLGCRLEIYCSADSAPPAQSVPANAEVHFDPERPSTSNLLTMEQLLERYKAATVVAIPLQASEVRRTTGLTALLEAIAMGRPVVMTENTFMNIEKAGFGRRVAPGDVEGWRRALSELTTDLSLAEEMGKRGRELCVAEFALPEYSARVAEEVRSVTTQRRRRQRSGRRTQH